MEHDNNRNKWTVSYKQLGILLIAFGLGVIATLLYLNTQTGASTSFSTTQLIGFVLTIIVSGASIVLAISAIVLGRSSEHAIITRSDESINLQTQIYQRTTDALARIESSTDVAGKRIEDLPSKIVSTISRDLAEEFVIDEEGEGLVIDNFKEFEDRIKDTITKSISEAKTISEVELSEDEADKEFKKQLEYLKRREDVAEKEYQENKLKLLHSIANLPGVMIESIESKKSKLISLFLKYDVKLSSFDGVFLKNESTRFAVYIYESGIHRLEDIIQKLAGSLEQLHIDKLYVLFINETFEKRMARTNIDHLLLIGKSVLTRLPPEISDKVKLSHLTFDESDNWAKNQDI